MARKKAEVETVEETKEVETVKETTATLLVSTYVEGKLKLAGDVLVGKYAKLAIKAGVAKDGL